MNTLSKSSSVFAEAKQYIPGGVNSPVRSFRSVGGNPPFITRGEGSKLYDLDGNNYIDYVHCAIKEFNPSRVVKLIKKYVKDPTILVPYIKAAKDHHSSYGAEATADLLWEEIVKRFPQVLEEKGE